MGLFASTLENRVGIEWYIFFTGVKVEVIQRSRSLSSVINRDSRYLSVYVVVRCYIQLSGVYAAESGVAQEVY